MVNVILTIHTLIVLALIGVVLVQRSDGSALGIGGGSGGGFMTGSGAANVLTRTTSILAAAFFATSLGLAIFAQPTQSQQELIEELTGEELGSSADPTSAEDLLRSLGGAAGDEDEPTSSPAPEDEGLSFDEAVELAPAPAADEPSSSSDEDPEGEPEQN